MQAILVCELLRLLTSLGHLQTKKIEKRKLEDNSQLLDMTFESSMPIHGVFGNELAMSYGRSCYVVQILWSTEILKC